MKAARWWSGSSDFCFQEGFLVPFCTLMLFPFASCHLDGWEANPWERSATFTSSPPSLLLTSMSFSLLVSLASSWLPDSLFWIYEVNISLLTRFMLISAQACSSSGLTSAFKASSITSSVVGCVFPLLPRMVHFRGLIASFSCFHFVRLAEGMSSNIEAQCSSSGSLKYVFSTRRIAVAWIDGSHPTRPKCCTRALIFFGSWYCTITLMWRKSRPCTWVQIVLLSS